jgi:hypothetical protein
MHDDSSLNSWEDLLRWKPDFTDVIHRWFQATALLVLKTSPKEDDQIGNLICACLTSSLPDINDIMTLSHKNSHRGAAKILRSLFERTVTLKYLYENPHEVQRFEDFLAIDTEEVITGIAKGIGIHMEEPGRSNLAKAASAARTKYKQDKCPQCKKPKYMGWTGMNSKDMSERASLGHMHLHAFLLPSKSLHTTYWGMRDLVSRASPMVNNLNCTHELIVQMILVHRRHFAGVQKGRVSPMMTAAIRDYLSTWTFSVTSFDGILSRGEVRPDGRRIYY